MGIETELEKGALGEFTVWVDDRLVVRKKWFFFPSERKILDAVRTAAKG